MEKARELDPVCGMEVDPLKAAGSVEYQGATFFFCSQACAAKFRTAPEKYPQTRPGSISVARAGQDRAAWRIHLPHASGDRANESG